MRNVHYYLITCISVSGASAGRRHAAFSSHAAASKKARGAGAEYDGVSALQLCCPHKYIINLSEHEEFSPTSVLPLSLSSSILALAATARNGRLTTSNLTFSLTWWPLIMWYWWYFDSLFHSILLVATYATLIIFWFSFSYSIAEANTCCIPNQFTLLKLYKSKSEGVESCLYIYGIA